MSFHFVSQTRNINEDVNYNNMMLEILVQNGLAQFKIQNKLSLSLAHTC